MKRCLIAFGGNLSNPKRNFLAAELRLKAVGMQILRKSGLWRSPAWPPGSDQPDYINAVIEVRFAGTPEALLQILMETETALGRERSVRNAPRTLDLDLLTFGEEIRATEALTLPHPRMLDRAFVLMPLCEIDSNWLKALRRLPSEDIAALKYVGGW
jgi:2-amino-4-hydroxy-6-hydroxymethyldihydropteridine diphosphokinase